MCCADDILEYGRYRVIRLKDSEFEQMVAYMKEHYGINLDKKQVLIECRMSRVLENRGLDSFESYLAQLMDGQDKTMAGELVDRLTTNYTYFMRESDHFQVAKEHIFPEVLSHIKVRDYMIWCAGCSTGEECYTLAMALNEGREELRACRGAKILATDISDEALMKARSGTYPLKALAELPEAWQKKYCRQVNGKSFMMDPELKAGIRFQKHNLMDRPPYPERFDMIFCRNVMIYFDKAAKEKLIRQLEDSLNPGGYLFVGHAELLSGNDTRLEQVYPAVYCKRAE